LLAYRNRTATAPKLSHKQNILDSISSSSESDDENQSGHVLSRRGSRQKRPPVVRKSSGFASTNVGTLSRRSSVATLKWRVVGTEAGTGEITTVTSEQMANAEKLATEMGMKDEIVIENAGTPISKHRR
jgi:hypothetical protein